MKLLRQERDKKLAETDWWALSDRSMTSEQTAYRQALRDFPNTITSPDNIVFPLPPIILVCSPDKVLFCPPIIVE